MGGRPALHRMHPGRPAGPRPARSQPSRRAGGRPVAGVPDTAVFGLRQAVVRGFLKMPVAGVLGTAAPPRGAGRRSP